MRLIQEKAIQLLKEFHVLCEKENLRYFLGPASLRLALDNKGCLGNYFNLDVLMPAEDVLRFVKIFEANPVENRSIDYMGNNPLHTTYTVEYVDKTTTLIKFSEGTDFACYGVKVLIVPIRKRRDGIRGFILRNLEAGWEAHGYRSKEPETPKDEMRKKIVSALMVFGRGNLAKWLFKHSMKAYACKNAEKAFFKYYLNEKCKINYKYYFGKKQDGVLEENAFIAPDHGRRLLERHYGDYNVKKAGRLSHKGTIILDNVPYEQFVEECEKSGHSLYEFFERRKQNAPDSDVLKAYTKVRKDAILIAQRSGDRLRLLEELEPQMEVIRNLYEREEFLALRKIFREHEKTTLFYLDQGLGFCVNKELLDIQYVLLRRKKMYITARRLMELVPEEHYNAIR